MQDVVTEPRRPSTTDVRRSGTVRWFSGTHGYGMIEPDDGGRDVFVEHDAISMDGFRTLDEGRCVEFDPSEDAHGPIALNVRPC